jgi:Lrp/AsnC family leucine-responsive transcriptional regulator
MNRRPSEPERHDVGVGPASLDTTDRKIVDILRRDGRTTLAKLGRATGLGTSAVHQRVRRLEDRRIITGYVALVDPGVLGLPISVAIWIPEGGGGDDEHLVDRLRDIPEVDTCYTATGQYRYLLRARVADMAGLEQLRGKVRTAARAPFTVEIITNVVWENRPQ